MVPFVAMVSSVLLHIWCLHWLLGLAIRLRWLRALLVGGGLRHLWEKCDEVFRDENDELG